MTTELPPAMLAWIRRATGTEPVAISRRAGGGASREGALLTLSYPDGRSLPCYLTFDLRPDAGDERLRAFQREVSAIEATGRAGIKVPPLVAADDGLRAMLTELVPGDSRFAALKDEDLRRRTAFAFMDELANLHRLDAAALDLRGFPPLTPPSAAIAGRLAEMEARHAKGAEDPLFIFVFDWLRRNIPHDPDRTVLVHGDAGPANFLHREGAVTAVLDWELTHYGDPMEDLAWICIRDLFEPFAPLPACFARYERASGIPVDLSKVRYYRVFALATLATVTHATMKQGTEPFGGVFGNYLMYYTLHLRTMIEGLADAMGLPSPPPSLPPDDPKPGTESAGFAIVLDELREVVLPRVTDELARHRIKAVARAIKYWEARNRSAMTFEAREAAELSGLLARPCMSVAAGRVMLVETIRHREIDESMLVGHLLNRVRRETTVMRSAMGALADRSFAPLH